MFCVNLIFNHLFLKWHVSCAVKTFGVFLCLINRLVLSLLILLAISKLLKPRVNRVMEKTELYFYLMQGLNELISL